MIYQSLSNVFQTTYMDNQLREFEESLEEKGQYVTITFTTTCNYLVFATKFLLSTTIVTSC
jgi:hypothetical protein